MKRLKLKEEYLDEWFFNLPAIWQMKITKIYIDESTATEREYEAFDKAITKWWDELSYDKKYEVYAKCN